MKTLNSFIFKKQKTCTVFLLSCKNLGNLMLLKLAYLPSKLRFQEHQISAGNY